jgi:enamine deaminase RidA (YjgF/YER057c/UK114 family)
MNIRVFTARIPGRAAALMCALILCAAAIAAQKPAEGPVVQRIQPEGLSRPATYSHVVAAHGGRIVFIAGQVAFNAKGEVVGKGDLRAQTAQVLDNLRLALESVHASFDDVVKINTYVVRLNAESLAAIREVRSRYFVPPDLPASTLVGVTALANPDLLIEIEAVAVVK